MPLARLNNGIELDYRDSGKPEITGEYETLLCVHGVMFNQEIFSPLLTLGLPDVRVITYNHRGYRGSSPLKPHELGDPISTRTLYLRDLIAFLEYLNSNLKLPRKPIVISFEKGANLLLGLASPTFLPKPLRATGIANVSCLIIHDCPGGALGRVPTSDIVKAMIACPYLTSPPPEPPSSPSTKYQRLPSDHAYSSASSSFSSNGESLLDSQHSNDISVSKNQFNSPFSSQSSPPYRHYYHREDNQSRTERHLGWICGFYKHQNHLPRDPLHLEPSYSSWAYKCSSNMLPFSLIDSAVEIGKSINITLSTSSNVTPTSASLTAASTLWKLSDDRAEQVDFAKMALVMQRDVPISLVWNGESPESTVDAVREAARWGAKVFLVGELGNSLMFAHEPKSWASGILKVAGEVSGVGSGRDDGGEGTWLV